MIYFNQATSLALIYTFRATKCYEETVISKNQIEAYEEVVNNNLKEMNSKVSSLTPDYLIDQKTLFFFCAKDDENTYYLLKSDDESIERRKKYIMNLPLDIVEASQKENALDILNLQLVDGQIKKKEPTSKKQKELIISINGRTI